MNNLILAAILFGMYYVAANVEERQIYGYMDCKEGDLHPQMQAGSSPACSLSFEDRQQLEELLESVE